MHTILFTINILIVSLLAERQSIFKSPAVLENENDPNRNTIYGEFFVFFKDCYTEAMIQEFVGLFKCYTLNHNVRDLFPHIMDHWIEMDEIENCDEPDVIVEWNDYCITGVEENEEEEPSDSNQCLSRPVESALWNLNTASPAITDGTQFIQFASTYNPNVDIIVMDSGIDTSHPQFSGITIERIFDAYPGEPALGSHGTHCAGTILGKDYGSLRINSDTQIKLIDVRIFPLSGGTYSSTVLNGYDSIINYLTNNPGKKVIINMSFGGGNWVEKNARLTRISELGGIIFAAAGNNNNWATSYSPASSRDTITVGAIDQSKIKAYFSNYGRGVDIWAPGVSIKSAIVGGGTAFYQGTSMAAPLVAGIAANILANNPSLDFWGIKNRLLSHAVYDVDDGIGNTNLPRVQASCKEYGFTPTFTLRPSSNYENCLDVHGDEGDEGDEGDDVHVHHCHFGSNQKWKRGAPDADGYYAIISLYNDECLDVNRESNGIVDYSDNIFTWPCHYRDNQKFKIDGGIIRVKENGGNWCVDFGDADNNVHIWNCDYKNDTQRIDAVEETIIGSKYHSGQCLDVDSGNNVYLHPCHEGTNQKWRRGTTDSDGYYTLISEYNQECLDVNREHNGIVDDSDNIITWSCHGADNQKFRIDGTLIKSKANGGNWCVDGGDYDHNVHIWDCSITNGNQQFEFPGFSSLTGSYSSAGSIGNMLESDDFEFMDKAESMMSGKYLIEAIAVLLMINIVCFIIYLRKRNNGSKKGYKVVKFDSSTDVEFPDQ